MISNGVLRDGGEDGAMLWVLGGFAFWAGLAFACWEVSARVTTNLEDGGTLEMAARGGAPAERALRGTVGSFAMVSL